MKGTNTTTTAAFTDEEIDEIMNDPMKKELAILFLKMNKVERKALIIFTQAIANGMSDVEAAHLTADFLDTHTGYEKLANDFRHWKDD